MKREYTVDELAKKHNVSKEQISKQLDIGTDVELEHTDDRALARRIASHHLLELPDYYTRLQKMEKSGAKQKKDIQQKEVFSPDLDLATGKYIMPYPGIFVPVYSFFPSSDQKGDVQQNDIKSLLPLLLLLPALRRMGMDRAFYPYPSEYILFYGPQGIFTQAARKFIGR